MIPGFRHDVNEICPRLGPYAAQSVNFMPTFRDNLSAPSYSFLHWWTLEDGTESLSRNVGTKLPFYDV